MYKCVNNLAPQYFDGMFQSNSNRYQYKTRSADNDNVYVPKCHAKSFANIGAKVWNSIPSNIKNSSNLGSFKRALLKLYNRNKKTANSHVQSNSA